MVFSSNQAATFAALYRKSVVFLPEKAMHYVREDSYFVHLKQHHMCGSVALGTHLKRLCTYRNPDYYITIRRFCQLFRVRCVEFHTNFINILF